MNRRRLLGVGALAALGALLIDIAAPPFFRRVAVAYVGDSTSLSTLTYDVATGHAVRLVPGVTDMANQWLRDAGSPARLFGLGVDGAATLDFLEGRRADTAPPFLPAVRTIEECLRERRYDLVVLNLGINDAARGASVADYRARMRALTARCEAAGARVMVEQPNPFRNGAVVPITIRRLLDAYIADQIIQGDVRYLSHGYQDPASEWRRDDRYADDAHPNAAHYAHKAVALAKAVGMAVSRDDARG